MMGQDGVLGLDLGSEWGQPRCSGWSGSAITFVCRRVLGRVLSATCWVIGWSAVSRKRSEATIRLVVSEIARLLTALGQAHGIVATAAQAVSIRRKSYSFREVSEGAQWWCCLVATLLPPAATLPLVR